jgi:hypothetical protein
MKKNTHDHTHRNGDLEMLPSNWLSLARMQAKASVDKELSVVAPLLWRDGLAKRKRIQFSVLLPATLMAVLFVASVTWALVGSEIQRPPAKRVEVTVPQAAVQAMSEKGPKPNRRQPKAALRSELIEKKVRTVVRRRRVKRHQPIRKIPNRSLAPRDGIMHLDERNGSVIIVSPPAKLPPLITPDSYINKR